MRFVLRQKPDVIDEIPHHFSKSGAAALARFGRYHIELVPALVHLIIDSFQASLHGGGIPIAAAKFIKEMVRRVNSPFSTVALFAAELPIHTRVAIEGERSACRFRHFPAFGLPVFKSTYSAIAMSL